MAPKKNAPPTLLFFRLAIAMQIAAQASHMTMNVAISDERLVGAELVPIRLGTTPVGG
jgi:hypothetical protein